MKIGNVEVASRLALAPMAGVAQTAPMTALPAAIHSGGVMWKLRVGTP